MGLEGLLLDEALEADVTLERSDAVVDEHMPLQVGRQGELPGTHITLVSFHPLRSANRGKVSVSSTVILTRTLLYILLYQLLKGGAQTHVLLYFHFFQLE